jgi:hypothetical protein
LRGLTTALTVLFWALAGSALLCLIALFNQRSVADDVAHGNVVDALSRLRHADSGVRGTTGFMGLVVIAIVVVFIIWFWRAAKNNELFGRRNARFTPGWSIGSWFIPLANLVIPVLIAQDLWRGSDQSAPPGDPTWRSRRGSAVVGWWWAGFLVSSSGRYVHPDAYAVHAPTLSSFHAANAVLIAGMIVTIPAAVLAIRFVRQLASRQESFWRRATANAMASAPAPQPMPYPPAYPPAPPFPG